ncbi:MAG TPA: ribonuclease P protein component [Steroidobacteraceae bacterium]|jgi:ribonuclease P protein component|nr:ribonuclease P protein component [Steroidobacteraceae bacterium]
MTAASTRAAATPSLRLPPERRMRRPAEFKRAYAAGKRLGNEFFTVNAQANGLTCARLGMSIAARILRRAVDRNRLRRLIRESFRANQQRLPPLDIVIGVRAGVQSMDNARLRSALEKLWLKISSTCER